MEIHDIVTVLKQYEPKKIILFGSYVYGKPREDSDYDIVIIKNTTESYHERLVSVRRLVRTTQPIDFFVFTEAEIDSQKDTNPLIDEIISKGKVIYPSPRSNRGSGPKVPFGDITPSRQISIKSGYSKKGIYG